MGWTGRGKAGEHHVGKHADGLSMQWPKCPCPPSFRDVLPKGKSLGNAKMPQRPGLTLQGFAGLGCGRILPTVPQIWRMEAGDVGRGSVGLFGVPKGT